MTLSRETLEAVARGQARRPPANAAKVEVEAPAWPVLDPAALHGVAGDFVRVVGPHTEADPVALLAQFLAYFGNAIGPSAHVPVEADRHGGNLFVAIVGKTSRSRKGTSARHVERLWRDADGEWLADRVVSGLSSGEGLIYAVRDPLGADAGVDDKRLMVQEGELAAALKVLGRDGNILSPILRNAWDGRSLQTLTRTNPMRATDPHISTVAHIPQDEVVRYLNATERANGLGNRFLWIVAKRAHELPEGGCLESRDLAGVVDRLCKAVGQSRRTGAVRRDPEARALWAKVYGKLTNDVPGLAGALIARSEAQVTRLALIYALLDISPSIKVEHLTAALALWNYSERSVEIIFGDATGDPVADQILSAVRQAGEEGLTRTELYDLSGRHRTRDEIDAGLNRLTAAGKVERHQRSSTGGRRAEVWTAKEAKEAKEVAPK